MKLAEQMPLSQAFQVRTSTTYHTMVNRAKGKTDKRGRVYRQARIVPFTLTDFRAWVLGQFGGQADGCCKCAYCPRQVTAEDFRPDHVIPISRGGSLGLENLDMACDSCNREKGSLTAEEYQHILESLDVLLRQGLIGPEGYKDVRKRLRGQTALFRKFSKKESNPLPPGVSLPLSPLLREDTPF